MASAAATASPGATDLLKTGLDFLPAASLDPAKVAIACEEATLGAGASMSCDDIVALTARIARTASSSPVQQISVTKPADDPTGIQVTFWVAAEEGSGLEAFTSIIDPTNKTFTFPEPDTEAVFPTAS
jgi:hypothetical protein